MTGFESAALRSATSASRLTVVCEVELLLPGTESAVALVSIEAVLARIGRVSCRERMWKLSVAVSLELTIRVLWVQVYVGAGFAQPLLADTQMLPLASTSLSV